jgi:hypothetical protein
VGTINLLILIANAKKHKEKNRPGGREKVSGFRLQVSGVRWKVEGG